MAEKVKLSEDGSSIDFVQSDSLPASLKKFRQSPEIEGFYRFIYENDLQSEAHDILDLIIQRRKAAKGTAKSAAKAAAAAATKSAKEAAPKTAKEPVKAAKAKPAPKVAAKSAPKAKAAKGKASKPKGK